MRGRYSSLEQEVDRLLAERKDDESEDVRRKREAAIDLLNQNFIKSAMSSQFDRCAASGVIDIARNACIVPGEDEFIELYNSVKANFQIAREKNGFHADFDAKGSGYRDVKLNIVVSHADGEW